MIDISTFEKVFDQYTMAVGGDSAHGGGDIDSVARDMLPDLFHLLHLNGYSDEAILAMVNLAFAHFQAEVDAGDRLAYGHRMVRHD